MSHQFLQLFFLPFLFSANSKCKFWQPYNFISFGSTFSQWELEPWLINQTHPLTTPSTSVQVQLSTVWKQTTISEHHDQRSLSSWKITLILLKCQWNFADWKLRGTWIIYSVPAAVLVSMWMLFSHHITIHSVSGILEIQSYHWELWFLSLEQSIDQSGQHQLVRPLGIFTCGTTNYARDPRNVSMTEEVKE